MNNMMPTKEILPPPYVIERATPDDAEGIVNVQIETWVATYVNESIGITEEAIRARLCGENGEHFAARIERGKHKIATSPLGVSVAKDGNKVVGFSSPRYDEDNNQQRLGGLYVLPEAQGYGLGKKLLEGALDALDKTQDIYLHAVTYNDKAIKFYEKNGFIKTGRDMTGSIDPLPNGVYIPEIEMKLPAQPAQQGSS